MARVLALCALLGVIGIVSAGYSNGGSMGNMGNMGTGGTNGGTAGNNSSNTANCPAKKYNIEGIVSDRFLTATDASGKNSGFIIDFLELMKGASGGWFDYKLTARSDFSYSGLVDDLVAKKFEIVAADLTVRSERQAVIDFLQPYLRSQIRILVNNNPTGDSSSQSGVLGYNPTFYIENDVSVIGVLQASSNATLNAIYQAAKAGNRIVDRATGIAALVASNSPAAFIGVSPYIMWANDQSSANSLLPDILETAFFAFGIQSNQNALRLCLNNIQLKVQETGQLQALRNQYGLN